MENNKEVKRIENFYEGEIKCINCGKILRLHWNGGELDEEQCCGYTYRTEHIQVDLVIYGKDPSEKEDK